MYKNNDFLHIPPFTNTYSKYAKHLHKHWVRALQWAIWTSTDYNGKARISTTEKHGFKTEKDALIDYN